MAGDSAQLTAWGSVPREFRDVFNLLPSWENKLKAVRTLLPKPGAEVWLLEVAESLFPKGVEFRKFLMELYPDLPKSEFQPVSSHDTTREVVGALDMRLAILRRILKGWLPQLPNAQQSDAEDCFAFFCRAYFSGDAKTAKHPRSRQARKLPTNRVIRPTEEELSFDRVDRSDLRIGMRTALREYLNNVNPFRTLDTLDPWLARDDVPDSLLAVLAHARVDLDVQEALRRPVKRAPRKGS